VKKVTFFLLAACIAAMTAPAATAQIKFVAVLETEVDAQSGAAAKLNKAEVRQITAVLRNEARNTLPSGKYKIMTNESIIAALGSESAGDCNDENCAITIGRRVSADYVIHGTVSMFKTILTLSIVMYDTDDGTLVGSAQISFERAEELLGKAAAECRDMYKRFLNEFGAAQKTPAPPPPTTYAVSVNVNPNDGGYVSRSPNKEAYNAGEMLTLTAIPYSSYTFAGWSGASSSTKATLTAPVDRDLTLTANFQYVKKPEPKPKPVTPYSMKPQPAAPKPSLGLAPEPPAKKRHTLAAVSLDAVGAGLLWFGYSINSDVKANNKEMQWTAAEKSASQRNAAYTAGSIILLSGISVHIFF
jgi:uncharacterized repeat protein (TIGR02543 family)